MNEKATIVRADSASTRDRAFSLHLAMHLKEPRKKGPLVINHGGGFRVSDENGKEYIECRAGLHFNVLRNLRGARRRKLNGYVTHMGEMSWTRSCESTLALAADRKPSLRPWATMRASVGGD